MRDVSQKARDLLRDGAYNVDWTADLLYEDEPRAQDLRLIAPSFKWNRGAQVQGTGQCTVLWDDVFGESIVPRDIGDLFSPFGAELQVDVMLSAGEFRERIPMGRFVLDSVPEGVEYAIENPNPPRTAVYSAWVEQRRNFMQDPRFTVTSNWGATAGTYTVSSGVMDVTFTAAATSNAVTPNPSTAAWWTAFLPGQSISAGYMVENIGTVSASMRIALWNTLAYTYGPTVVIAPGQKRLVSVENLVVPAGSTYAQPRLHFAPGSPSGTRHLLVSEPIAERSEVLGSYFDGSGSSGPLQRDRWLGVEDASVSVVETRERSWVSGHAAPIVAESRVSLDLADYFMRIARDSFAFPTSPQSASMWDEAQRLTGLPVFQSIPDRVLPTNLTYEEDRLNALEKVFSPSNAWPHLTPDGALTALPKAWTAPVDRLERVLSISLEMRSENVFNRVVVEGKNPDPNGKPLIAVAEIRDGFLRTRNADGSRSPFAGNTFSYSSDFLVTQAQCQAYADELLPKVARMRSVTRRVTEPFNPLREVGDVLTLVDPTRQGEESIVRVIEVSFAGGETTLQVEVSE